MKTAADFRGKPSVSACLGDSEGGFYFGAGPAGQLPHLTAAEMLAPRVLPGGWRRIMQASEAVKLSGEWVGICEALAWVLSRDTAFSSHQDFGSRRRASLVFAAWLLERHGNYAIPNEHGDIVQAEAALLSALRHGEISAVGIPGETPGRAPTHRHIETFEWARLRLGSLEGDAQRIEPGAGIPFHDLLFKVSELVSVFHPPTANQGNARAPQTASDGLGKPGRKTWQRPMADDLLRKAFPDGPVPSVKQMANNELVHFVLKLAPEGSERLPSTDVILRAAGRRQ